MSETEETFIVRKPCPVCNDEVDFLEDGEWKVCQDCCPHDEKDHSICLSCGKDCLDDDIARAENRAEGDR